MDTPASTTETGYAQIVGTPGVMGGEPRIANHRIRVRDIVAARDLGGLTPEEIAATVYPRLTLSQGYSALAYYEDHRQQLERASQEEKRFIEEFLKNHPELVCDLRRKRE